jgi:hypothetical protein
MAAGGFDETLQMGEDHDFVRRAACWGPFGVLKSVRIPVSLRRVQKEGLAQFALKGLWCELHVLSGKPMRRLPFAYEFGAYASEQPVRGGRPVQLHAAAREPDTTGHVMDDQ